MQNTNPIRLLEQDMNWSKRETERQMKTHFLQNSVLNETEKTNLSLSLEVKYSASLSL